MTDKVIQKSYRVTQLMAEQIKANNKALGMPASEVIRAALAEFYAKRDLQFEDNMRSRGGRNY